MRCDRNRREGYSKLTQTSVAYYDCQCEDMAKRTSGVPWRVAKIDYGRTGTMGILIRVRRKGLDENWIGDFNLV